MNNRIATAGNNGEKDRSDCFVSLELTPSGGIQIDLSSKVKALYGKTILALCSDVLQFFGIENAILKVEDKGALPFVMTARIEAAVKQLIDTDKEFLPEMLPENLSSSTRDQRRISRLYLPGNTPALMLNAGIHAPNGIILDLEDAVGISKKPEARYMVRNALRSINFIDAERMVRINQIPAGLDDLDYLIPHHVNLILVPKCESATQIQQVNQRISTIQEKSGLKNPVWLMPIIESAMGVMKALEIAQSAENVVAMAIGLEDYTADIGTQRTAEGTESFFARCQVVNACKAAGIQAIDSVFSDISDMEALKENVLRSKALGFDGMGCIHPRQIKVIHDNFAPDEKEIENAKNIVLAFFEATEKGIGVVSLGNKMIDAPVVKRAHRTIDLAVSMGKLDANWVENFKK
jgi:citrate lyase subunit beta/citryl-CoA lyase